MVYNWNDQVRQWTEQLNVGIDYEVSANRETVTVKFTVTNSWETSELSNPEVHFEQVLLEIGTHPDAVIFELGALEPQESVSHEYSCGFTDLVNLRYSIHGSISPDALLRFQKASEVPLPGSAAQFGADAYIRQLRHLDVHQWLEKLIKPFPIPDGDTTLAEIQSLQGLTSAANSEIQDATEQLHRILTFIKRPGLDRAREVQQVLDPYFTSIRQELSKIGRAVSTSDPRQISGAVRGATEQLTKESQRVDEAVNRLESFL